MRREGRQHGMIRTFPINQLSGSRRTTPAANNAVGLFTKPTNHSKFTGKCARPMCRDCHIHPACKSKPKAKGAHKLRSTDLGMSGASAMVVLDYLDSDDDDDDLEYT